MRCNVLNDSQFNRKLINLALPITFQSLMLALVATADAFMLGSVEQNSMAAVSLASQVQFVQNMLVIYGMVSAINILGAQYWGKGDKKSLNDVFFIGLKAIVLTSSLFFIGCVFFPHYLMLLFTNEQILIDIGAGYLRIAGWSYLLTGISQCFLALMKLTDRAKQSAIISSVTVILNIILNALLIFGVGDVIPALGVRGAAFATLTARIVEVVWSIASTYKKGFFHVDFSGLLKNDTVLVKDFLRNVLPLIGAQLFWGVGFTSYTAFVGHLGANAAAANSVATVIRDLIVCLCTGIGAAASIMVGNELGAGNLDRGKDYGHRFLVLAFGCGFVSMILMLLFTPLIMPFIKLNEEAGSYLLGMMIIMAVYMIGRAANTVIINGIFAAGGDTMFDFYSLAVVMWGIAIPLCAIGTFWLHWPVLLVYACTCLDEIGKIPWVLFHYRKYKWVKDLTR